MAGVGIHREYVAVPAHAAIWSTKRCPELLSSAISTGGSGSMPLISSTRALCCA
jgi:hypothetical protein